MTTTTADAAAVPTVTRRLSVSPSSARSLLFTILGELVLPADEPVWTSALLQLLGEFDIEEKAARQAISRTGGDGWISAQREGRRVRWVLTSAGRKLLTDGAARIYSVGERHADWDGAWLVVTATVPESQRRTRHQLHTRLAWAGLGNPAPGMWVTPHAERGDEVASIFTELGLAQSAVSFVGPFGCVGSEADLVDRAWDLSAVAEHYARFLALFEEPEPGPDDNTLSALVRLVHEWRRFPFLDPQLPDSLLPEGWIGHRARGLFDARYDAWRRPAMRQWKRILTS